MTNSDYDLVEQAENKATENYDKILIEFERLSQTMHDVRRNVDFIISDIFKTIEDTPENNAFYGILQNANSTATDNRALHDMVNVIRDIAYCVKVKARDKARDEQRRVQK